MWEYSDKTMDHFLHPRNVGEVENPDGVALVGNIACGDALKLTFKLDDHGRIKDAGFKTFGCASAIASASALTEMIKGMTMEEAAKVTDEDIADYLGGLPKEKIHCSVMGREALEKAIAHYKGEAGPRSSKARLICECFGVTEAGDRAGGAGTRPEDGGGGHQLHQGRRRLRRLHREHPGDH